MDKATNGLTRTSSAIRSSAEIIDVLGRRADEIGKIIEVIDDLAEQTNLLALNAAIEAARAGEHGLGFAVVAEEVRKLAEKSTQSTKEISDLIQGIQKEAREAVENMEKSTTMVQQGLELGAELNVALTKISDVVSEVYKYAQQIGGATNRTIRGLDSDWKGDLSAHRNHAGNQFHHRGAGLRRAIRWFGRWKRCAKWSSKPHPVPHNWPPWRNTRPNCPTSSSKWRTFSFSKIKATRGPTEKHPSGPPSRKIPIRLIWKPNWRGSEP